MSSSSEEDDDLKRVAAAVDSTFLNTYRRTTQNGLENNGSGKSAPDKPKSERYLVTESHYNDVRVSAELQRRIAHKLSDLIESNVEFVSPTPVKSKRRKIKGGVKLFSCSPAYLSTDVEKDTATEEHNERSSRLHKHKRTPRQEADLLLEEEKIIISTITSEQILSGDETKHWKSRRKEKLFKYKKQGNSKILISLDDKVV